MTDKKVEEEYAYYNRIIQEAKERATKLAEEETKGGANGEGVK
jgi:hypothetical protein